MVIIIFDIEKIQFLFFALGVSKCIDIIKVI